MFMWCLTQGDAVALKFMSIDSITEQGCWSNVEREVRILQSCHHPNVLSSRAILRTSTHIVLVTEVCLGGTVEQAIETGTVNEFAKCALSEAKARAIFRQVVVGIQHCHEQNIVHRDIKPANILLDVPGGSSVKIADFGVSDVLADGTLFCREYPGTEGYAAPEVECGKPYGTKVDLYSLGCTLLQMVSGMLPEEPEDLAFDPDYTPEGEDPDELDDGVERYILHFPANVSKNCRDLIMQMVHRVPGKRASLSEVQQHPWLLDESPRSTLRYLCENRNESLPRLLPFDVTALDSEDGAHENIARTIGSLSSAEDSHEQFDKEGSMVTSHPAADTQLSCIGECDDWIMASMTWWGLLKRVACCLP